MKYTSRGLRRRGEADQWEATLSHRDPLSGEVVRSYHTITARTEKQARRKRDELILELERKGASLSSKTTVRDYLSEFVAYKKGSGTVEPSTIRGYEKEARQISKYIVDIRLGHASRMLVDTTHTVAEICYETGFNTICNFNRLFKKRKGCSPTEFRDKYRKTKIIV